jgi:hypothetical protein
MTFGLVLPIIDKKSWANENPTKAKIASVVMVPNVVLWDPSSLILSDTLEPN